MSVVLSDLNVPVEDLGDLSLELPAPELDHVHTWEWMRTGRVPGSDVRWREHVCPCGESLRSTR